MGFKVAIDGPAGAGKSSVAKAVAEKLGLLYIDSGAMYRAATLYFLRKKIIDNPQEVVKGIKNVKVSFKQDKVFLNGEDVSEDIRTPEVTNNVKKIASIPEVREYMVQKQREFGQNNDVIMDGRDITTVVFYDADVKIYLDASVEERTRRRVKELEEKGIKVNVEKLKKEIIERDISDKNRKVGPLKIADDAIYIDTSSMTFEEVVKKVCGIVKSRYDRKNMV